MFEQFDQITGFVLEIFLAADGVHDLLANQALEPNPNPMRGHSDGTFCHSKFRAYLTVGRSRLIREQDRFEL